MNKDVINKLLRLEFENDREKDLKVLRDALTTELFKNSDNKANGSLATKVKKYLNSKEVKSTGRSVLATVMHTKTNKLQCICNGITGYIFKEYIEELENLPQTESEMSFNLEQIVTPKDKNQEVQFTEEDLIIINNIAKYKSFNTLECNDVLLSFGTYNIDRVQEFFNFIKVEDITTIVKDNVNVVYATTEKIEGVLLPLRLRTEDEKQRLETIKNEFIKNFKEIN